MVGAGLFDLFWGLVGYVHCPHDELVALAGLVIRDEILEVPGRVAFAAPGGGLG